MSSSSSAAAATSRDDGTAAVKPRCSPRTPSCPSSSASSIPPSPPSRAASLPSDSPASPTSATPVPKAAKRGPAPAPPTASAARLSRVLEGLTAESDHYTVQNEFSFSGESGGPWYAIDAATQERRVNGLHKGGSRPCRLYSPRLASFFVDETLALRGEPSSSTTAAWPDPDPAYCHVLLHRSDVFGAYSGRPSCGVGHTLDDYAVQSITTQDFLAVVVLFNAGTSAGDVTLEWYARGANSKELLGVSDHTVQAMQQLCVSATFPVTWSGRRAIVADWTATGCYTDDGDSVQVGHVVQAANAPTASALTVVPTALSSSNTTEPTALPSPSPTALPCANLDDLACTSLLDALGPAVCSTALCPSCGALAGVCALSCGFCDATPIPTPPPQPTPAPLPTTACEDTPICATTLHNSTAADLCSTTFCTSCVSEGLCDRSCGFC